MLPGSRAAPMPESEYPVLLWLGAGGLVVLLLLLLVFFAAGIV